ncbi:hypothetical protein MKEN_00641300 [Mycena kentingensis (nom. inval.)]|nr:hypothetical protein MKEN_00641300 [Mycena kentingensis (nom. inval.)]
MRQYSTRPPAPRRPRSPVSMYVPPESTQGAKPKPLLKLEKKRSGSMKGKEKERDSQGPHSPTSPTIYRSSSSLFSALSLRRRTSATSTKTQTSLPPLPPPPPVPSPPPQKPTIVYTGTTPFDTPQSGGWLKRSRRIPRAPAIDLDAVDTTSYDLVEEARKCRRRGRVLDDDDEYEGDEEEYGDEDSLALVDEGSMALTFANGEDVALSPTHTPHLAPWAVENSPAPIPPPLPDTTARPVSNLSAMRFAIPTPASSVASLRVPAAATTRSDAPEPDAHACYADNAYALRASSSALSAMRFAQPSPAPSSSDAALSVLRFAQPSRAGSDDTGDDEDDDERPLSALRFTQPTPSAASSSDDLHMRAHSAGASTGSST